MTPPLAVTLWPGVVRFRTCILHTVFSDEQESAAESSASSKSSVLDPRDSLVEEDEHFEKMCFVQSFEIIRW